MFGEIPQSYGFHNLNSQSVFLADGTERDYFTPSADYPLEQATLQPMSHSVVEKVGVTALPSVAAQAADLAPVLYRNTKSTADSESLLVHDMQPPTAVQDDTNGLKEMHVSDVSDEEK